MTIHNKNILALNGKIYVPRTLRHDVLTWYHHYLCHPGATRLEKTIASTMCWPRLATECKAFVRVCAVCQCAKRSTKKYGHLPAKSAEVVPWDQLCVDLVGPLTVTIDRKKERSQTLKAMTFIDPATGWFEIAEIDAKDSASISQQLDQVWLSRYP